MPHPRHRSRGQERRQARGDRQFGNVLGHNTSSCGKPERREEGVWPSPR
jgi:hypothetical protein